MWNAPRENWDQGWRQLRAPEEAAKPWVREGVQVLGIACWHVRVVEHSARRVVHAQVQQEWATHRKFLGPNSLRPPTNKGPRGAGQQ